MIWGWGAAAQATTVCTIQMSQASYVNGNTVTVSTLRLATPGTDAVKMEWKIWLGIPTIAPLVIVNAGADGSLFIPAGFDQNFGPITLFPVTSSLPRGTYEFSCRIRDPVTGALLAESLNPFAIQ
jgi:hypothetical protein